MVKWDLKIKLRFQSFIPISSQFAKKIKDAITK